MPSVHVSRCRPPRRWGPNPIGRLARLAAHSLVSRVAAPKATIRVALLALGMALTLLPVGRSGVARADGLADEADLHFRLGFECFKNDDVNCALEHWLVSNRLVPNRNVVYNIARAFARSGRFADAHRYYVDALEGESDAKTVADIKAALASIAPKVGVLSVTTDPPGAVIYIGRKDLGSRGRTPRPLALEPGSYKVLVELEGYEPASSAELQLAMGEDKPVSLKLNRILGTVQVGVEGAKHATVHVGDERAASSCEAPCTFDLPPGTYLLYFAAEGYQSVPRQVVVAARQTAKTVARLKPQSGSIIVEADEKGAVVEVDERPMGFTPTVVQNVGVGTRKVRVKLRGYRTVERSVEVKPNQQAELLDLRLEPLRQVSAVSRAIEDIDDAPSSLSIIDGQELRAFGYPTVAEALRGTRGVYLSNDYSYFSAGIRGLGEPNDYGNRLLVLADGHPTNDNVLNSSYIGTDARLDLYDVERIEVVRGPGSLLYGTGAFSGVVNLVTRPRDEPTSVNGAFGTWGNSVAHGRAGGHVNFAEDAGMWASVSGSYSDGVDVPLSLIEPGSGPPVVTVSGADAHRAINTAGHIWWGPVEGQWMYHKRIQFVPVGALSTRINDLRTSYTDERAFGEVRYEPKISDAVQIFTRAHVNHYFFHGFYISPEPDPALLENYYGTWFGGEARVVVTPLDDPRTLRIVVGGEGQYHPVASLYGDELGPNLEELPNGNYLSEERSYALGAAYALLESTPIDWFRLSAGVRVDIYSTFGPIVVPRGALIFKPWEGGVIKLMSGRAGRGERRESRPRARAGVDLRQRARGVAALPRELDRAGQRPRELHHRHHQHRGRHARLGHHPLRQQRLGRAHRGWRGRAPSRVAPGLDAGRLLRLRARAVPRAERGSLVAGQPAPGQLAPPPCRRQGSPADRAALCLTGGARCARGTAPHQPGDRRHHRVGGGGGSGAFGRRPELRPALRGRRLQPARLALRSARGRDLRQPHHGAARPHLHGRPVRRVSLGLHGASPPATHEAFPRPSQNQRRRSAARPAAAATIGPQPHRLPRAPRARQGVGASAAHARGRTRQVSARQAMATSALPRMA
jgi:outer membrane receptor for ferrienterochelin and colicins